MQVETLGEFGVFFTLFLVGLEFSPEKLRKVSPSVPLMGCDAAPCPPCTTFMTPLPSRLGPCRTEVMF